MSELATKPKNEVVMVQDDGQFENLLDTARFEHLQRVANLFSQSDLIPEHYRGKLGNCFIAMQMAIRLHVDPFMFMQNTYIVHGRPGMEAKLAIALVNARGPFRGPIQWKMAGTGVGRQATAFAVHKQTGEVCEATVTMAMAEAEGWTKNPKWKNLTDLMLQYRAATFLARLYCPETLMGMATKEEIEDLGDRAKIIDMQATVANPRLAALQQAAELPPVDLVGDTKRGDSLPPAAGEAAAPEAAPAASPAPAPVASPAPKKPGRPAAKTQDPSEIAEAFAAGLQSVAQAQGWLLALPADIKAYAMQTANVETLQGLTIDTLRNVAYIARLKQLTA